MQHSRLNIEYALELTSLLCALVYLACSVSPQPLPGTPTLGSTPVSITGTLG
ncbi:hypothetical protein [Vampirovibrio chlorellavorus]|uniref:hypothetical protein n=1 Tax=Vampirovibrio chlorellavorus TaxID=758823 RepID=UPI0026EBD516|nr:hypothetical protein [Vampirovibrio chlorellavorus]